MSVGSYDHVRSTDADDDDAVYRVVGSHADSVTLLRVSDGDGRRAHTGEVITISRDALNAFEAAENPDGNRSLVATLRSTADATYWALRTAGPLMLVGAALAIVGTLGNVGLVPLPALAVTALIFAGFGCIFIAIVTG